MSRYIFRHGISEGPRMVADEDRVRFVHGVSSNDFRYDAGDVVERSELPEQLLERWESRGIVVHHTTQEASEGFDFKIGQVVEGADLGELLQSFLERGIVEPYEEHRAAEWTMSISPEKYLERYPNGPNADLARRFVG